MGIGQVMEQVWGLSIEETVNGMPAPGFMLAPSANFVLSVIQMIAVLMFLALTARLGVVLPGKALRIPGQSIRRAWQVTRGHSFSLMMGFISCVLPFLLLTALMRRAGFDYSLADGPLLHIADWLALETMGAVLGLIEVAYLSYCFLHFFPEEMWRD